MHIVQKSIISIQKHQMIAWRLWWYNWSPNGRGNSNCYLSTLTSWINLKAPSPEQVIAAVKATCSLQGKELCDIYENIPTLCFMKNYFRLSSWCFNSFANLITLKSDVHDIIFASNNSIFCIVQRVHCVTPIKAILIQNRKPAQTPVQWASNYTICFAV